MEKHTAGLSVAALVLTALASPAFAAFGDTDTSFGTNGFAINDLGGAADTGIDLVTGAGDRLYALGLRCATDNPCSADSALLVSRFSADGDLDPEFGNAGDVVIAEDVTTTNFRFDVHDDDELIYIARTSCTATQCAVGVTRYEFDGTVDPTYGAAGTSAIPVADVENLFVHQLLLQPSGKLLVLLESDTLSGSNPTATKIALMRLNANGSLDTTFGQNGVRHVATPGGCDLGPALTLGRAPVIYVTAAQADTCAGPYTPVVMRLTNNGNLDANFGSGGRVVSNFGFANDIVGLVAQEQSDGDIAYGIGRFLPGNGFAIDIIRLNPNGTRDTNVAAQSGSYTPIPAFTPSGNSQFQSNGRLVLNGRFNSGANGDEALTRIEGSPLFAHPPRFSGGQAPFVGFSSETATVNEGDGTATISVVLANATDEVVTVPFSLAGSAARGLDYEVSANAFTIQPGATTGSITLTLIEDGFEEFSEAILVTLGSATNAVTAPNHDNFILVIEDNDLVPVPPPPETDDGGALGLGLLGMLLGWAGVRRLRRG